MTFVVIALITQSFIGRFNASRQLSLTGPYVWQMIWFSIFSMAITYPLGLAVKPMLSSGTLAKPAITYFQVLNSFNFLFPLGAALSTFLIGRGRSHAIFYSTLATNLVNLLLSYLLIFGYEPLIQPLGILGAAIATVTSQFLLCIILFVNFLKKKNRKLYNTSSWNICFPKLWEILKKGVPYSFGRVMVIGSWTLASYIMIGKEGDYVLILSFGATLLLILSFLNEGLAQGLITITSYILGSNSGMFLGKMVRSSIAYLSGSLLLLAVPLLLFPKFVITLFIKTPLSDASLILLQECCLWTWFACLANGLNRIGTSLLVASQDTFFYAVALCGIWVTLYIPVFIGIGHLNWSPPKFFLVDSISAMIFSFIYFFRFKKNCWNKIDLQICPSTA